jgi:hypothetical protein
MNATYGRMNEQLTGIFHAGGGARSPLRAAEPPPARNGLRALPCSRHWPGFSRTALLCLCLCFPSLQTPAQSTYSEAYTFTTLAGSAGRGSADGVGNNARFSDLGGVAADSAGNIYVADVGNHTIRKITPAGVVSTLAGYAGSSGTNDGTGSNARFYYPSDVAVDSGGNVYVADSSNSTIRKITPAGVVSTLAGLAGSSGTNDGTGSSARFSWPHGVAVDSATNVYVADTQNNTIRKVTSAGG